jgi:hypothetical protein
MPTKQTLNKYGLTQKDWDYLYKRQEGNCAICGNPLKRANIDHFHVKGWKKMKPQQRRKFVRGLLCFQCNYLLLNRMTTLPRLRAAVVYLAAWETDFELAKLFEE